MFPAYGMKGAAIATVTANFLGALAILWLTKRRLRAAETLQTLPLQHIVDNLRITVPATVSVVVAPIGFAILTNYLTRFGDQFVAAFGLFIALERLLANLILALSSAGLQFSAQNWAASNYYRVKMGATATFLISMSLALIVWLSLTVVSTQISAFFSLSTVASISFSEIVIFFGLSLAANSLLNCSVSLLNGIEGQRFAALLSILDNLILLPLILFVILEDLVLASVALASVAGARTVAGLLGAAAFYLRVAKYSN